MRKPRKYRVRKKMAEFLVKEHIPSRLIRGIIVKNREAERRVVRWWEIPCQSAG